MTVTCSSALLGVFTDMVDINYNHMQSGNIYIWSESQFTNSNHFMSVTQYMCV